MTEKSRTEYSARNATIAMISQVIAIVMGYATRVVFTHTLSVSYVGVNGLFTDILNVLALSELGIGTAITYALYKPIAQGDVERQKSVMRLFRQMYRVVALLILAAGLLVVPFLGRLVSDAYDVEHLTFIYLLYLANSVLSYLFAYKKTLADAHQLHYIGVLYHTGFLVIQDVLQILVLLTTQNFILFMLICLACTVAGGLCVAKKAEALYPYLRDKKVEPLPQEEKRGIVRNIRAMLMHKVGSVAVNNTDNLLLSAMVGIASVGKYSNYYLIIGSVRQVLEQIFRGITASVGNLGVTADRERVRRIFEASFFIGQWIYGFAGICLFELLNWFVTVSFGEGYLFSNAMVLVLCLNFFVAGMRQATLVFRDSLGLFRHDRYKSLAEAIVNLAASVLLTLRFGAVGVFLGTFISTMTTSFWIEPYVLYRKELKSPVAPYFLRYALYCAVVFAAGLAAHLLCGMAPGEGFTAFAWKALICMVVPNGLFLLVYHRTREFHFLWSKLTRLLSGRRRPPESESPALESSDRDLLDLLREALTGEGPTVADRTEEEWETILLKAERHAVLPLLFEPLSERPLSKSQRARADGAGRKAALQSYRLACCTDRVIRLLREQGIEAVVLKGISAAEPYPTPEMRKSGDIDILIPHEEQLLPARDALIKAGFAVAESQLTNHHIAMDYVDGIELELHSMLAEPFDNNRVNGYLKKCLVEIPGHTGLRRLMGYELPALSDGYQAFQLLLHMLQHFLRAGFGLKLLCDWVVLWNRPVEEEELDLYFRLLKESGLLGFSRMITSLCVRFLGLRADCALCGRTGELLREAEATGFLRDILEAEEFGKSSKDRMVTMRGNRLWDYVREFHHMTCLNYPKGSRVFLLWPALWCATLLRFLRNNRRVRGVKTSEILKKAGERSGRMEQLALFKTRGQ